MKQTINLIPVGIAFFVSAALMLMVRLNVHEMDFVKGAFTSIQTFGSNRNVPSNNPRYSSFHLKGIVYNSDDRIDKWMKDASDLTMPKK